MNCAHWFLEDLVDARIDFFFFRLERHCRLIWGLGIIYRSNMTFIYVHFMKFE